jgi:hypothetical protein
MTNLWVTPDQLGDYAEAEYSYDACKAASQILWALSGRRYGGIATVTERYVCAAKTYRLGASSKTYNPVLLDRDIYNIPSEEFDNYAEITSDGLSPMSRIRLRGRPVVKIHAVRNRSGGIIDSSKYYLVDHSTLQAAAGIPWTPCNVEVTYTYGSYPPAAGAAAARILAMEFVKLWSGDDCALPERVTTVSRQGVSFTLLDNQDFVDDMRTGLYAVDLFLKSVNPDRARSKSRVFSPDMPRARRSVSKPMIYGESAIDLIVTPDGGSMTASLASIDAEWLTDGTGWDLSLDILNYSGSKSTTLQDGATVDASDETVTLTAGYRDVLGVLGMVDVGQYDLYATRPSLTNPSVSETVRIISGNVRIKLSTSVISAYNIGSTL